MILLLLRLFFEFFMTGMFMFGGGMAAVPFLQQMGERTGWFTMQQLMDIVAVTEASPGPLAVDMATYAGYLTAGFAGGTVATLGLLAPTAIIAMLVAKILARFKDNPLIENAFYGLRPAALGLIASAGLTVLRMSVLREALWVQTKLLSDLFDVKAVILAVVLFITMNIFKKANPVYFLLASAVVGIFLM